MWLGQELRWKPVEGSYACKCQCVRACFGSLDAFEVQSMIVFGKKLTRLCFSACSQSLAVTQILSSFYLGHKFIDVPAALLQNKFTQRLFSIFILFPIGILNGLTVETHWQHCIR